MEQIKNDKLVLTVSEHGAELQSIKDNEGKEYLWDGDEKYWNRHSPILFPLVCGLWKDTYRCEGHTYHLAGTALPATPISPLSAKVPTVSPLR